MPKASASFFGNVAPQMSSFRKIAATAIVATALYLDSAEAVLSGSADNANAAGARGVLASQGAASSGQTLARGTVARNVRAAQYAVAAHEGFFSWCPGFGWRWFLGWWASKGEVAGATEQRAEPAMSKLEKRTRPDSKLDDMIHTHSESFSNSSDHVREMASGDARNLMREHARSIGTTETLSEAGYQIVAKSRSEMGMMNFVRRVLAEEHMEVTDEEGLYDLVKFYDGECATQTYRNLLRELHMAEHPYLCHRAWTRKSKQNPSTKDAGLALALLGVGALPASQADQAMPPHVGSLAAFNEQGYQAVAKQRSTTEMMVYIERVLGSLGLEVSDKSGLRHFAPYYSGECAMQSYERLVWELKRAPTLPVGCGGGWVVEA